MQNGKPTIFSPPQVLKHPESVEHYRYLLGQTLPYHKPEMIFQLKDILFIVDKNNNPILWAKNKVEATQFVQIGEHLGFFIKTNKSKPEEQLYFRMPDVKPVIHEEKDRDERAD